MITTPLVQPTSTLDPAIVRVAAQELLRHHATVTRRQQRTRDVLVAAARAAGLAPTEIALALGDEQLVCYDPRHRAAEHTSEQAGAEER